MGPIPSLSVSLLVCLPEQVREVEIVSGMSSIHLQGDKISVPNHVEKRRTDMSSSTVSFLLFPVWGTRMDGL